MSKWLFLCAFFLLIGSFLYVNIDTKQVSVCAQDVALTLSFYGKQYQYLSTDISPNTNFYFLSEANKNGRGGTLSQRAALLKRLLNMGIEPMIALGYCFVGLDDLIMKIKGEIDCEPQDALYRFYPDKEPHFRFTVEKQGYRLDLEQVVMDILEQISKSNNTITLHPQVLTPQKTYNDIKDYQQVKSSFFTTFDPSNESRRHNIKLALSKLNGLEIKPNEIYSFNELTGRRTEKAGYKQAKIIVDKKYVDGVGGGVCQVSTTLYNVLLLAGVDILEVHSHSLCSSYINLGFDAMVNFGSADLKWQNTFGFPLFIKAGVEGDKVNIVVFGKDGGDTLRRVSEVEEEFAPPSEEVFIDENQEYTHLVNYDDEEAYIQLPHKGYVVRAFLEKYQNGKLVERKFLRRVRYRPSAGIKVKGVKRREAKQLDGDVINFWQKYKYY